MSEKKHIPIRTCISCRTKRDKKDLLRLVIDYDGIITTNQSTPGRGVYICPVGECVERLFSKYKLYNKFCFDGNIIETYNSGTKKLGELVNG